MYVKDVAIEPGEGAAALYDAWTPEGAYLDIETTGLSARNSRVYLAGCLYRDGDSFLIRQWMTESPQDEYELLFKTAGWLRDRELVVHYNGLSFDIPFLKKRMAAYGIVAPMPPQMDLMRILSPYKAAFGFENMKLRTVQEAGGFSRKDLFTGKELINDYLAFESSRSEALRSKLLRHNLEDIAGLLALLPLFPRMQLHDRFLEGELAFSHFSASASHRTLRYAFGTPYLPENMKVPGAGMPVSLAVEAKGQALEAVLELPLFRGSLRHYVSPPGDYRYIPEQDTVCHKDAAKYLEGATVQRATRETAYLRKEGLFIELPFEPELPHKRYRRSLEDPKAYVLLEDLSSRADHENLVKSVLSRLCDRRTNGLTRNRNPWPG